MLLVSCGNESSSSTTNSSNSSSTTSSHTHSFDSGWEHDETYHWHKSTCGHDVVGGKEEHVFKEQAVAATYEEEGYTLYTCEVCDYSYKGNGTAKLTHTYATTWSSDKDSHWHACTDKGYETLKGDEASHTFKDVVTPATYSAGGYTTHTCTICGYSYTDSETSQLIHNYSSDWSHDSSTHWHACTDSGYESLKKDETSHTFKDVVTNPTYEAGGYTTHTCTICGYSYTDSETSQLIHNYSSDWSHDSSTHWHACTDSGYESLKKDETSHTFKDVVTEPTYDEGGYTTHTCTVCGYSYKDALTPSQQETERNKKLGITPVFDETNKTVTYGSYPQTHVSDSNTIAELNKLTTAESNGWYLYNDEYYAKKSANPYEASYTFDDGTTIKSGTTYWFKCEPIKWKILTSSDGTYSLVSTVLLDAHQYASSSNNYMNSEIRAWLNNDFLNSAFNLDSSLIQTTTVDNSASTTDSSSNTSACTNTEDKIYLLSYKDYLNADYGFSTSTSSTTTRECKTTDYARANGIWYSTSSLYYYNGWYWTRSPNSLYSNRAWNVNDDGSLDVLVYGTDLGVRPAITIKI